MNEVWLGATGLLKSKPRLRGTEKSRLSSNMCSTSSLKFLKRPVLEKAFKSGRPFSVRDNSPQSDVSSFSSGKKRQKRSEMTVNPAPLMPLCETSHLNASAI